MIVNHLVEYLGEKLHRKHHAVRSSRGTRLLRARRQATTKRMEPRPFDRAETAQMLAFLGEIGIAVAFAAVQHGFLPGVAVRGGAVVVDPDRLQWPGDLLHEAGHIAVTAPERRSTLDAVPDDPGEEMATIAWCWAAGKAIGLAPEIVFHNGYKGGGPHLVAQFSKGCDIGVPMLSWFELTGGWKPAEPGRATYPAMDRWLR